MSSTPLNLKKKRYYPGNSDFDTLTTKFQLVTVNYEADTLFLKKYPVIHVEKLKLGSNAMSAHTKCHTGPGHSFGYRSWAHFKTLKWP